MAHRAFHEMGFKVTRCVKLFSMKESRMPM